MLFTGQAEVTIDAKGRLAIPAKFRARWDMERDGPTWYSVPWPHEGVLRLYTENYFETMAERWEETIAPAQDSADLDTNLFGFAEQINLDANKRLNLPGWHLELLNIPREVVVVGARNRLEVRSREAWMAGRDDRFNELRSLVDRLELRKVRD